MKTKKKYRFPWRKNNSFQVLVDGNEYFSSMLNEIKNSKTNIFLETYLFESGQTANLFIDELCAAKNRGVDIFIILDEFGTKNLKQVDKQKMTCVGIKVLLYHPSSFFNLARTLKRDHRKLLAVDNQVAFIGGAGITDQFNPKVSDDYWHDVMLKINGDIVFDLIQSFNTIWKKQNPSLNVTQQNTEFTNKQTNSKARILIAAGTERNEVVRAIITRIRASKKHIWLTSPYFISSWKIRRALRHAAKKGIDVRLVFPGPYSDHKWITYGIQRYYQRMLKANIAIYEFQPRFNHSKIILCDDWYSIGSSNLDRWNQFLNLDANIEVYDKNSHQQILNLFKENFSQSKLVILNQWRSRPWIQKIKEWHSGWIIHVLEFISQKFKR